MLTIKSFPNLHSHISYNANYTLRNVRVYSHVGLHRWNTTNVSCHASKDTEHPSLQWITVNALPLPLLQQHLRKSSATGRTSEGRETVSLSMTNPLLGIIHSSSLASTHHYHTFTTLNDMICIKVESS